MKRLHDYEYHDASYRKLGLAAHGEENKAAKPTMATMFLEGRKDMDVCFKTTLGAGSMGGNRYHAGTATSGFFDDLQHKKWRSYYLEQELQQEPNAEMEEEPEYLERLPCRHRVSFIRLHLKELEVAFQNNQCPNVFSRDMIAKRLNLTEARVKMWFLNRRAKGRRHQKAFMFPKVYPITTGPSMGVFMDRAYNAFPGLDPSWRYVPVVPQPVGPHGPPVPPGPPMPPVLPVPPLPPGLPKPAVPQVPPFGMAPVDRAWDHRQPFPRS